MDSLYISENLYNKLYNRIQGWIYKDCTDILQPYFHLTPVQRVTEDKVFGITIYATSHFGNFVAISDVYDIGVSIDSLVNLYDQKERTIRFLIKDDDRFYIWQATRDLWIGNPDDKDEYDIFFAFKNQGEQDFTLYCYGSNNKIEFKMSQSKIYGFLWEVSSYCHNCKDSLIQNYICQRKRNFMYVCRNRYDLDFKSGCGNITWDSFKQKYKKLKEKFKQFSDRVLLADRLSLRKIKERI